MNDKNHEPRLLIVPYGIETGSGCVGTVALLAFNRTLWN